MVYLKFILLSLSLHFIIGAFFCFFWGEAFSTKLNFQEFSFYFESEKNQQIRKTQKSEVKKILSKITEKDFSNSFSSDSSSPSQGSREGQNQDYTEASLAHPFEVTYPEFSRRKGEEGQVVLELTIGVLGEVISIILKQSSGFTRLDQAALKQMGNEKFRPALLKGKIVESKKVVIVNFVLKKNGLNE